jgi:glycosyltransferase involved in cell wall biosynthesis
MSETKPINVLHVTPSFYPAIKWGGPIFSTKAICDGIAALPNMKISVLTTDAAGPDTSDRLNVAKHTYFEVEKYTVTYTRRIAGHAVSPGLLMRLPNTIRRADVVHLTGTYNFPTLFTLLFARLLGTPVVWSPRGALQATATWSSAPRIRIKHLFEKVAQLIRPKHTVLLVTSDDEGSESVTRLKGISVHVIPNSVNIPTTQKIFKNRRTDPSISLLYLSRIHPKKGIETLLSAMRELPSTFTLDIYGDGDPNYIKTLHENAADLGARVKFKGIVSGDAKIVAYQNADIFVLPSYSENFGIVVAEALAAKTPVVTTTNTPWEKINSVNCGRCIDLEQEDLAKALLNMADCNLKLMGEAGQAWMRRSFSNGALSEDLAALYKALT